MSEVPLLSVRSLGRDYGTRIGCRDVTFDLWSGEIIGIVGESGSGKTTLLNCLSGRLPPGSGQVLYDMSGRGQTDLYALGEAERRFLMRTDWGFVHQNPRDGLRLGVTAGANIGERLMAVGARHYGNIRTEAAASSGESLAAFTRCSSRPTSNSRASNRSVKNFRASSGVPSGYWPTERSPSAVLT